MRSWFGVFPYRCTECEKRFFRSEWEERGQRLRQTRRTREERRKQLRKMRAAVIYAVVLGLALLALFYILRHPKR